MERKELIKNWINHRIEENEIYKCVFQILLLKSESKEVVEDLLIRNGFSTYTVDTIGGCFNLNDDWYELSGVESIVEYCGVYPIHWNIDDVVLLESLYYNRCIYINVLWEVINENGEIKYISNH